MSFTHKCFTVYTIVLTINTYIPTYSQTQPKNTRCKLSTVKLLHTQRPLDSYTPFQISCSKFMLYQTLLLTPQLRSCKQLQAICCLTAPKHFLSVQHPQLMNSDYMVLFQNYYYYVQHGNMESIHLLLVFPICTENLLAI